MYLRIALTQVLSLALCASANSAAPDAFADALAENGCVHIADDAEVLRDRGRWWLVSSSRNPEVTYGPAGVTVANPIIDTTGGSAGALFACYSGQWYRIGLD